VIIFFKVPSNIYSLRINYIYGSKIIIILCPYPYLILSLPGFLKKEFTKWNFL